MRALAIFAAIALIAAPVVAMPAPAYADGIERPRRPRAPRPRPAPPAPAPERVVIIEGPETVTLNESTLSGGGVGADIATGGSYYSSSTVVISGGRASAFAYASARASAGVGVRGGFRGGGRRGGGGCGCH
jgi:uncharacterized membrane protein YgcG